MPFKHSLLPMYKEKKISSTYINMAITEAEKTWIMLTTGFLGNNLLAKWDYSILNGNLLYLKPEYTI